MGVPISDPSVQALTHSQWLFMAEAFSRREKQEAERQGRLVSAVFKAANRSFRDTLIYLLGLHIGAGKPKKVEAKEGGESEDEEDELTPYIPLVGLLAKPELIEELLRREKEEETAAEVLDDENLGELHDQLMNLEAGDLEPIFSGKNSSDPFEQWYSQDNQEMLRAIGVDIVSDDEGTKEKSKALPPRLDEDEEDLSWMTR